MHNNNNNTNTQMVNQHKQQQQLQTTTMQQHTTTPTFWRISTPTSFPDKDRMDMRKKGMKFRGFPTLVEFRREF